MSGVIDQVIQPVIGSVIGPVVGGDIPLGFRALFASMGVTQDKVVVSFSDVPQNFTPIAGVQILIDGLDGLNAAIAPVLSGATLTYTLNNVQPTDVNIQWVYSEPPGLISDGIDLAPSRTLTAQAGAAPTIEFWDMEATPLVWDMENGTDSWNLESSL